jgi:hypothetical protein
VLPNSEGTENKYADELLMVLGSFGKPFSVRTLNMLQSTFYRACNRSLSSAEWLSRWGEALGKKRCKIVTAAGMLGKPLERTRARVANGELPVVIRDGERLIPTTAVVRLHEQLLGQNPSSLSPESNEEAPGARQHQSPTSSWPNNEPRGFSARTVAEAIDVACAELGVSKEDLTTRSVAQGCCTCSGLALGQRL